MPKEKSLKLNAFLNVIKQVMNLFFPLISFPYSSRILNPDGVGRVNFALSIISYFALFASLGIGSYATRESAKIRDDKLLFSQFTKEIVLINFSTTIISYLLFFIALFAVPQFKEYRVLLCVCSSTILFSTFGVEWLYKAKEEFAYMTIRGIIFQIIGIILLFLIVKQPEDYIKYASISVISSVGSNLLNFINLRKFIILKTNIAYNIKRHLKPVIILFATDIAVRLYNELDKTMLGFISTEIQVGLYSAATKLNHLIINVINALIIVLGTRLSYNYSNNYEAYKQLLKDAGNIILMLCIPSAFGIFFLSKNLVQIFCGDGFLPAINVMRFMSIVIIVLPVTKFCSSFVFLPARKDKYTFYPVIAGVAMNAMCNIFLIIKFGALGAGIATDIAECTVSIISFALAVKVEPALKTVLYTLYQYVIAAAVMGFVLYFFNDSFANKFFNVLINVLLGAVTYFFVLFFLKNEYVCIPLKKYFNKIIKETENE